MTALQRPAAAMIDEGMKQQRSGNVVTRAAPAREEVAVERSIAGDRDDK